MTASQEKTYTLIVHFILVEHPHSQVRNARKEYAWHHVVAVADSGLPRTLAYYAAGLLKG